MTISSQLNGIAHGTLQAGRAENWKEAIKIAIRCESIIDALEAGPVAFTFRKKDGTIREAKGTRNADLILSMGGKPFTDIAKMTKAVSYYDLECGEIRAFIPANMIYAAEAEIMVRIGDSEMTLRELIEANMAEGCDPLDCSDITAIMALPVGESIELDFHGELITRIA